MSHLMDIIVHVTNFDLILSLSHCNQEEYYLALLEEYYLVRIFRCVWLGGLRGVKMEEMRESSNLLV